MITGRHTHFGGEPMFMGKLAPAQQQFSSHSADETPAHARLFCRGDQAASISAAAKKSTKRQGRVQPTNEKSQ
jgi:hypothetical protein